MTDHDQPRSWLARMPVLSLARGVSITHVSGDRSLDRVCIHYNKAVGNWICSTGGSTPNYRVDIEDDLSLLHAAIQLVRNPYSSLETRAWVRQLFSRMLMEGTGPSNLDLYTLADHLRRVNP